MEAKSGGKEARGEKPRDNGRGNRIGKAVEERKVEEGKGRLGSTYRVQHEQACSVADPDASAAELMTCTRAPLYVTFPPVQILPHLLPYCRPRNCTAVVAIRHLSTS